MRLLTFKHSRGAADIKVVATVLLAGIALSILLTLQSCIIKIKKERAGMVEMSQQEYEQAEIERSFEARER